MGASFSHLPHHGDHVFLGVVGSRGQLSCIASKCNSVQWQQYTMITLRRLTIAWARIHAIFILLYGEIHYYKNVDLSRLGNPCCPGFPTGNASPGQKGGLATGTKEDLLSRLVTPTGTKGAASAHVAGAPFCPGC